MILFHAGFELFSGGFIGVDVFFVISGYLITTILIEDIENKRFSIVNFYERRARRILPALFFVMLVCIPFAWIWMLPNQMKDFSQSLVAVSLFLSNILFYLESGYFAAVSEEKPLLHTWSLAVEEQYYILFPIFLILSWRFGKNRVFWIIVLLAALSLLLSEWSWRNKVTANFYLAPTRAWELLAGSIAAFIVQKQGVQKNNLLSVIGLVAIFFSIFFYDQTTPFPSVYALVPVLGAVLLVLYADKDTFVAKMLSTKGFVTIGLISYSTYLWHQPLFAFARIRIIGHLSLPMILALIFLSFLLGYLSWKFVENPFRRKIFKQNKIFIIYAFALLIFIIIGTAGQKLNGFSEYLPIPNEVKLILDAKQSILPIDYGDVTKDGDKKILFIGDSLMLNYAAPIQDFFSRANYESHYAIEPGCVLLPNIIFRSNLDQRKCDKKLQNIIDQTDSFEMIFIGHSWTGYSGQIDCSVHHENCKYTEMLKGLGILIEKFRRSTKKIIVIGIEPRLIYRKPKYNINRNSSFAEYEDWQRTFRLNLDYDYQSLTLEMNSLIEDSWISIIHPVNLFCNDIELVHCNLQNLFFDSRHLTRIGQEKFGALFGEWWETQIKDLTQGLK